MKLIEINWNLLSGNHNAIELLKENQDKINWNMLSQNPAAIELLEQNQDKINWYYLFSNPSAIHLLEQKFKTENYHYGCLCKNPAIFVYDYDKMKQTMYNSGLKEDLIKNRFHPNNVPKFKSWKIDGFESDHDDLQL